MHETKQQGQPGTRNSPIAEFYPRRHPSHRFALGHSMFRGVHPGRECICSNIKPPGTPLVALKLGANVEHRAILVSTLHPMLRLVMPLPLLSPPLCLAHHALRSWARASSKTWVASFQGAAYADLLHVVLCYLSLVTQAKMPFLPCRRGGASKRGVGRMTGNSYTASFGTLTLTFLIVMLIYLRKSYGFNLFSRQYFYGFGFSRDVLA